MKKEKRLNKKQKAGIITLAFALIIALVIVTYKKNHISATH